PAMAIALNNLAEFYLNQGRIDDAEPLYLKALNISRKTLGEDHPRLGLNWLNLGRLYLESERLEEADFALAEANHLIADAFDAHHPWQIDLNRSTAVLRLQQGHLEAAEALGRKAHADAEAHFGPDHSLTASSTEVWGQIQAALGQTLEADRLLTEAYRIHRTAHGESHPETVKFCGSYPAICAG
ncbi:MAG: tetratricopeptide repeat protein, partial [Acidobacteriota bacterium]